MSLFILLLSRVIILVEENPFALILSVHNVKMLSDLDSDCEINVQKFMYAFILWTTYNFNEGRTRFICELIKLFNVHLFICYFFLLFLIHSFACLPNKYQDGNCGPGRVRALNTNTMCTSTSPQWKFRMHKAITKGFMEKSM